MGIKLNFSGSHIGTFGWKELIQKFWIFNPEARIHPIVIAQISIGDVNIVVWISRLGENSDDCMIDELKPLFGLIKLGTHRITIVGKLQKQNGAFDWVYPDGTINAMIHKSSTEYLISPGPQMVNGSFVLYPRLSEFKWYPSPGETPTEEQAGFFREVQSILLFRDLFRIPTPDLDRIRVRPMGKRLYPISYGEHKVRDLHLGFGGIYTPIEKTFFPLPDSKGKTLVSCLNLNSQNYRDRLMELRIQIERLIEQLAPNKIWLANTVYESCVKYAELYFSIQRHHRGDVGEREEVPKTI